MREEFEKLPEIAKRIAEANSLNYDEKLNAWTSPEWDSTTCCNQDFVNAAWYAFQEQQKKIDEHSKKLKIFIDELKKTHNDDKDNKIDYWRGFSDCADSSVKVFLQDVGFIE